VNPQFSRENRRGTRQTVEEMMYIYIEAAVRTAQEVRLVTAVQFSGEDRELSLRGVRIRDEKKERSGINNRMYGDRS
jgi:hypothetical protein